MRQPHGHAAPAAVRRLEGRRVLQLLEVVFVGAVLDEEFQRLVGAARRTVLPPPRVSLVMVDGADRVFGMVRETTVARVGKRRVLIRVVANPVSATGRARELAGLAAQPAARLVACILYPNGEYFFSI